MHRLSICLLLASLAHSSELYLFPSTSTGASSGAQLSAAEVTFTLSRHLGLDAFETLGTNSADGNSWIGYEESFVGQGVNDALVVSIDESVAKDVIPDTSVSPLDISYDASDMIATLSHKAKYVYVSSKAIETAAQPARLLDLFSFPSPSTEAFIDQLSTLSSFLDSQSLDSQFLSLHMSGLSDILASYGKQSEEYTLAAQATRAALSSALSHPSLHLAVISVSPSAAHGVAKRQAALGAQPPQQSPFPIPSPAPQQPIGSVSTCFTTADKCTNATSTCSGRGECVQASKAGRTCFVCACSVTQTKGGKKENWAGEMCERKDISGPFVLLTGTVIGLILLIGSSITLLYSIGQGDLPSVLLGGAQHSSRKE